MAQPRRLTDADRRAYARAARANPDGLSKIAGQAGVEPETVQDWIRRFFGSTVDPPVPPAPPPRPPPVSPTTILSATEDATDALTKSMKRWFKSKRKRRKDAKKLRGIISDWQENYKRTQVVQPETVVGGRLDRSTPPHGAERTGARPPETCNVYILDAGLLPALASNDHNAWACLETLVGELNTVVVPAGAIGCAFRDEPPHTLLESALASACVKQVPLDYVEARAAGMLCRATPTSDLMDASTVVAAKACRKILNRRRAWRRFVVHIVTQDVNGMTSLIRAAGLRVKDKSVHHNWNLIDVAL